MQAARISPLGRGTCSASEESSPNIAENIQDLHLTRVVRRLEPRNPRKRDKTQTSSYSHVPRFGVHPPPLICKIPKKLRQPLLNDADFSHIVVPWP